MDLLYVIANEWVLKHKRACFFTFSLNIACVAAVHAVVNIRVRQGLERLRRRQSYSQIDSIGVSGDKKGLHWYQWYDWYQWKSTLFQWFYW